jgi:hypothetical protein
MDLDLLERVKCKVEKLRIVIVTSHDLLQWAHNIYFDLLINSYFTLSKSRAKKNLRCCILQKDKLLVVEWLSLFMSTSVQHWPTCKNIHFNNIICTLEERKSKWWPEKRKMKHLQERRENYDYIINKIYFCHPTGYLRALLLSRFTISLFK